MKINDHAKGHWPEIVSAVLGQEFADTRKNQPCPHGEGTDRYRFSDKYGTGTFFCACSDGKKDGFDLIQCAKGCDFKTAAQYVEGVIGECPKDGEEAKPKPESFASRLRREVVKTKRSGYLENRGLEVPPILDWHKSLPYFDKDGQKVGQYPAMLSPLMRGTEFVTYHATYLKDGDKAPLNPCRKIFPANYLNGAAVPLYEPRDGFVGIAEGIETAIAAKILHGLPVWAALNTALHKNWDAPEGVTSVAIFADNDENHAGQAAAETLAHKLTGKGLEVSVKYPPLGMDWNDVLVNQKVSA